MGWHLPEWQRMTYSRSQRVVNPKGLLKCPENNDALSCRFARLFLPRISYPSQKGFNFESSEDYILTIVLIPIRKYQALFGVLSHHLFSPLHPLWLWTIFGVWFVLSSVSVRRNVIISGHVKTADNSPNVNGSELWNSFQWSPYLMETWVPSLIASCDNHSGWPVDIIRRIHWICILWHNCTILHEMKKY